MNEMVFWPSQRRLVAEDLKRDERVYNQIPKYPVVYHDGTRGTLIMDVAMISVRRLNVFGG